MRLVEELLKPLSEENRKILYNALEVIYHPCGKDILYGLYHFGVDSYRPDFKCRAVEFHYLLKLMIECDMISKEQKKSGNFRYLKYTLNDKGKKFAEDYSEQVLKNPPTVIDLGDKHGKN